MARDVSIFNAGPAVLPEPVIKSTAEAILNFAGTGMSIMEVSHRSKEFENLLNDTIERFHKVMNIPQNYKILFLQGGASLQFGMVPMNLRPAGQVADYVDTGMWASKAIKEAKREGAVNVIASSKADNYAYIPELKDLKFTPDAAYCHITSNNTIYGTQWQSFPDTGKIPLVADMSSDIMSRVIDVNQFGLIYAGAQKNIGPSGVTVVIIRDDLVERSPENLYTMLSYKTHVENNSLFNTCPVIAIYVVHEVLKWVEDMGGVAAIEKLNNQKAALIYDVMDASNGYYKGTVEKGSRSKMNIPFRLPSEELEKKFVKESEAKNLIGLKGHRAVGGIRASIYNAIEVENVQRLADFMVDFAKQNA
ncbi:MAG: Phosphoserine aminotransferase [Deltaproteobacteria bacterium ADurb.Bin510]|nr:MAG: Phosphoserine aminotransferase [Deltaproteobacteria bacterium ADurb.Bin510]